MGVDKKRVYWLCGCGQKRSTGCVGVDKKKKRSTGCVGVDKKRSTGCVGVDKKRSTGCVGVDKGSLSAVWTWTDNVYCLYGRGPENIN